jgi:sporadic carbohydrate cluster 2OG-Fe(II) oxygenase/sporadic carbohydrate cluster protein (TIGR04323 family)
MELTQSQQLFDNKILDYDLSKYPFPSIILDTIRKFYPDVTSLDNIHEVVPADKIAELNHKVSHALLDTDYYNYYDQLVNNLVVPKLGTDVLIQKFGNLRILVPDQDKVGAVLLFHQGRWVGNGLGLRTIWMPFTDCYDTNTLQMLDLDVSRDITRKSVLEKWDYERIQNACAKNAWPVTLHPGQAHLFFQEHLHGNFPNKTGKTRVSMDIRLLVRDGQPHRKWPGAYFRKLFDRHYTKQVDILPGEVAVTHGEYEGVKTKHIDLHFQTLVVKSYCQKRGYTFPYQGGDNEGTNYSFLDFQIANKLADHILLFSIFSLPDDPTHRKQLMATALDKKCRLHFCNEEMVLETQEDLDRVEYLRSFTNDWSSPVEQLQKELGLNC